MIEKTVVIGLGNPILSDDSVGIKAARVIKSKLNNGAKPTTDYNTCPKQEVDVVEIYAGGIRLLDVLTGYQRAIIIDAIVTGESSPGAVYSLQVEDTNKCKNISSVHDLDLATTLNMGNMIGLSLPKEIKIYAIEAKDIKTFGESLSDPVATALPKVVEKVLADLS